MSVVSGGCSECSECSECVVSVVITLNLDQSIM